MRYQKLFIGAAAVLFALVAVSFFAADPALALGTAKSVIAYHDGNLALHLAEVAAAVTVKDLEKVTAQLEEVTTKFNKKSDELAALSEKAMAELKDKGTLIDTMKAEADKGLIEHNALMASKNKLEARLTEVEQELARRDPSAGKKTEQSIGAQFVANEKTKDFVTSQVRGKHRLEFKAAITSVDFPVSEPSVLPPMRLPGTLEQPKQRLFVRDLIPVGQTDSPAIFWVQQTGFTNAAKVVSEGTLKPQSTIEYEGKMTAVTTIAHTFKASKQILADFKQLRSDIDREMRYGLKYVEEREILFGDGTGIHLHGIVPQATAFNPEIEAEMHNRIDDIRVAMLQSQLARLPATGIVMHFIDWTKIELTKDANGQYIFANPMRLAGPNLWGLPVVSTEINEFETKFLLGGFAGGAQIYDRETINVEIATENEDDFVRNMITGRCEERVGLAVFRPESFIFGEFTAGSAT